MACVDAAGEADARDHMARRNRDLRLEMGGASCCSSGTLAAKLLRRGELVTTEQYREYMPGIEQGQYGHPNY
jgi:hypothetical protein